jgi:hypothetical protein
VSSEMDPDLFITIAFAAIALLVALLFVVAALPKIRRESAGVRERESSDLGCDPDRPRARWGRCRGPV